MAPKPPPHPKTKEVLELWEKYNDFEIIVQKTGLTIKEIKGILTFPRLPRIDDCQKIDLEKIDSDCNSDRLGDVQELADHIREYGLLEPILVEEIDIAPVKYKIQSGQRRFCAFIELNKKYPDEGYNTIPAIVDKELG